MAVGKNITRGVKPVHRSGKQPRRRRGAALHSAVDSAAENQNVIAGSGDWPPERRQSTKAILARCLLLNPRILILDEPTRGIDIGAKYEIYKLINQLVQQGIAVIVISSELPEVLGLSDRVLVMHEGKLKADLHNQGLTQNR